MPDAPLSPCTHPGCPALVRGGRCEVHRKAKYRQQDDRRESAAKRGYDGDWRDLRNIKLAQNPLCEDCESQGFTTLAREVHHIVPIATDKSRRLDMTNLMSLCKPCHSKRTMAESVHALSGR